MVSEPPAEDARDTRDRLIDAAVRVAVRALPREAAYIALEREDPAAAVRLHPHDSGRVARALREYF